MQLDTKLSNNSKRINNSKRSIKQKTKRLRKSVTKRLHKPITKRQCKSITKRPRKPITKRHSNIKNNKKTRKMYGGFGINRNGTIEVTQVIDSDFVNLFLITYLLFKKNIPISVEKNNPYFDKDEATQQESIRSLNNLFDNDDNTNNLIAEYIVSKEVLPKSNYENTGAQEICNPNKTHTLKELYCPNYYGKTYNKVFALEKVVAAREFYDNNINPNIDNIIETKYKSAFGELYFSKNLYNSENKFSKLLFMKLVANTYPDYLTKLIGSEEDAETSQINTYLNEFKKTFEKFKNKKIQPMEERKAEFLEKFIKSNTYRIGDDNSDPIKIRDKKQLEKLAEEAYYEAYPKKYFYKETEGRFSFLKKKTEYGGFSEEEFLTMTGHPLAGFYFDLFYTGKERTFVKGVSYDLGKANENTEYTVAPSSSLEESNTPLIEEGEQQEKEEEP